MPTSFVTWYDVLELNPFFCLLITCRFSWAQKRQTAAFLPGKEPILYFIMLIIIFLIFFFLFIHSLLNSCCTDKIKGRLARLNLIRSKGLLWRQQGGELTVNY